MKTGEQIVREWLGYWVGEGTPSTGSSSVDLAKRIDEAIRETASLPSIQTCPVCGSEWSLVARFPVRKP